MVFATLIRRLFLFPFLFLFLFLSLCVSGDDFFNLHNRVHQLLGLAPGSTTAVDIIDVGDAWACDPTCRILYTLPTVRPGDVLRFFSLASKPTVLDAIVVGSITAVTDPTVLSRARSLMQSIEKSLNTVTISLDDLVVYRVSVAGGGNVPPAIAQASSGFVQYDYKAGSGALVENNVFYNGYDSCMRLQGLTNITVRNNTFGSTGSGMTVVFDSNWFEGSIGIHNVTIANNTFNAVGNCDSAAHCIAVDATVTDVNVYGNTFNSGWQLLEDRAENGDVGKGQ